MAKWFIVAGLVLVAVGVLMWLGNRLGVPFGRLPGDISVSGENYSFYFPVVTGIVLSVILTIVLNLIFLFWKK